MREVISLSITIALLWVGGVATASGQQPDRSLDSPYSQRLSPYLDLLRNDNSILHPYHSFVQPRRQVQQRLRQQSSRIGQLEQDSARMQSASSRISGSRMQTGRGGRFQTYLHYYQFDSHPPRR